LIASALLVLSARHDLATGRDELRALRRDEDVIDLVDDAGARERIDAVRARFRRASGRLRSPVLAPLRAMPFLGRQSRSAAALARGASHALDVGIGTLERVDAELDGGLGRPADRSARLTRLETLAHDAAGSLRRIDLGPRDALVGSLADARDELSTELDDITTGLTNAERMLGGMAAMLGSDGRYLLLAGNNAQMQNGTGMFLSAGILAVRGGSLELGSVTPTHEIAVPAEPVALDPDMAANWPSLDPNHDWRHLGTTPRFGVTAKTAADLWAATGAPPVDGVIAVDVLALRDVLEITGPITVGRDRVQADTVLDALLHDQYVEAFGAGSRDYDEIQGQRRDRLGAVARGAFDALERALGGEVRRFRPLVDAVHGRHLLAWSPDRTLQAGFEGAGVDGSLAEGSLSVGVLNRGGNKLDYFLDMSGALVSRSASGGARDVTLTVTLANRTPAGEPAYIAGPYPKSGLDAGQYLGILTLEVPDAARDVSVDGDDQVLANGFDGRHRVLAVRVLLDRDDRHEVTFRFRMPSGHLQVRVEPSARARPVAWSLRTLRWTDESARTIDLR
jgi:hypothetical protein